MNLTPGTVMAGYRIDGVGRDLGQVVRYRATELAVDRPVELYVSGPDSTAFRTGLNAAVEVEHPDVLPVLGTGEANDLVYAAVPYLEGSRLDDLLRTGGRLEARRAARLGRQIAPAVDRLDAAGAALEPGSIVVIGSPDHERAMLDPVHALVLLGRREANSTPAAAMAALLQTMGGPAVTTGGSPSARESAVEVMDRVAPNTSARRRRVATMFAVVIALLAGLVAWLVIGRGDETSAVKGPAGRQDATIDLGADATLGIVYAGERLWVATEGGVIQVDPKTNAVTGEAIFPGPANPVVEQVASGEGSVWGNAYRAASDRRPVILRIDPSTGRITGRLPRSRRVSAIGAGAGRLWVVETAPDSGSARLLGFDPLSLQQTGAPIPIDHGAHWIAAAGDRVWVLTGRGTASIVEPRTGEHRRVQIGAAPLAAEVLGESMWVADPYQGVTRLRASDGSGSTPSIAGLGRFPLYVATTPSSVWIATLNGDSLQSPSLVYRLDSVTGDQIGDPLQTGTGMTGITAGAGSIWAVAGFDRELHRITPSEPPPAVTGTAIREDALSPGPLPTRRMSSEGSAFAVPLSLEGDDGWVVVAPQEDAIDLLRYDDPGKGLSLYAPRQLLSDVGKVVQLRSASQLLAGLRANRSLVVADAPPVEVLGKQVTGLDVRVGRPLKDGGCEEPCVQLFPLRQISYAVRGRALIYPIEIGARVLVVVVRPGTARTNQAVARLVASIGT